MKTPRIYYGALAVFCAAVLVIGTAGAVAMTQQESANNSKNTARQFGLTQMLTNLTAKGYDVSAIQTAVTSGDFKTAQTLLQQFKTAHPDAFPAHGARASKGKITGQAMGERMTTMLTNLTAKGYDVSAIQTAVTSGDYRNASTLLQQFRTAHPDAFPAHTAGAFKGHPVWQRRTQTNQ
jgi:ABC-type uncharacterized transport system substrate-binding protein